MMVASLSLEVFLPLQFFERVLFFYRLNESVYIYIYIILFYLTLQYCIGFAMYQNESATGIHVLPILFTRLGITSSLNV